MAVSPDGANVYVAGGTAGDSVATSFGAVVILKRDPATGAIAETGCLSSDGTDGRDGASGACTPTPSLLGADGVAVSPDGSTVFVSSSSSASVVAFSRNPATGSLTRTWLFAGHPAPAEVPVRPPICSPSSSAPGGEHGRERPVCRRPARRRDLDAHRASTMPAAGPGGSTSGTGGPDRECDAGLDLTAPPRAAIC